MRASRVFTLVSAVALFAACGSDDGGVARSPAIDIGDALPSVQESNDPASTVPPHEAPQPDVPDVVAASPEPAVVESVLSLALEQPAIWPAEDVVFATPEEAAADFVREVLISEGEPELGEFQFGDSRSGEITVLFPGEAEGSESFERGSLALRQLGPDNGWFVLGAGSEGASITAPEALSEITAGPLTVEGEARGFEGTVVVQAFSAGDIGTVFDQVITRGGAFEDLESYSVVLDLSNAVPGEVIALLVQGDTGLGNDPSDFAAIPIVVENIVPPTR